jgi:hypothetical protein
MTGNLARPTPGEIKKRYVTETVLFAINNIPDVDRATLERFLELVNATGSFGMMTYDQILNKMRLTLKYVPNACSYSLRVLAELLEIPLSSSATGRYFPPPPGLAQGRHNVGQLQ